MPQTMKLPELFVLRHGETEWNRAGRFQGIYDSPLTEKGRAQAVAMGQRLAAQGVAPDTHDFVTSPQGRSRMTAQIALTHMAPETGLAAREDARLREISMGDWNGVFRADIEAGWSGYDDGGFLDLYARAPGGESFESMWERVGAFLDELARPTVVFTHGITSRVMRTRAMGLSLDELAILPGGQGVVFHLADGQHVIL